MRYPKGVKGKIDRVFSSLVRERSDWTCERCGSEFPEARATKKTQGLHCSHWWGRSRMATRWHPNNAFAHCMGCHRHLSSNPTEFDAWVRSEMAEWVYDDIVLRANSVKKYYKADLEEMLEHYKAQLKYMERRRAQGENGYIEFVGYD